MERRRVETARKRTSGRRYHEIIGTRETGDGVEQDGDILALLHETLRPLDGHLGHPLVVLRNLVEG